MRGNVRDLPYRKTTPKRDIQDRTPPVIERNPLGRPGYVDLLSG